MLRVRDSVFNSEFQRLSLKLVSSEFRFLSEFKVNLRSVIVFQNVLFYLNTQRNTDL
jgi:hypothetical protein